MTYHFPALESLKASQVDSFRHEGYLVVKHLLSEEQIASLRESFPKLFAGQFDTGVYPDEWYWREGMSLPNVTRHIGNAWKADLSIAKLALSEDIGRVAAALAGWSGSRLAQDTIWWKAPNTKAIAYHQDSSFMDFLNPPLTVTSWITLDDTHRDAGTLEYVPRSHLWPLTGLPEKFHSPDDYRAPMKAAAAAVGVTPREPVWVEVPAGSCVFHSGEIWHGSGPNPTADWMRRSIGIHIIHADASFSERRGGYIHRRYQRTGDPSLDESFFPILWSADQRRTSWIESYCEAGERRNSSEVLQ